MRIKEKTTPPLRQYPREPKGAQYILPILIFALGIGVAIGGTMRIVRFASSKGIQLQMPGETPVTISSPGEYRLWLETRSIINGTFYTFPDAMPAGSYIEVTRQTDNSHIELETSGTIVMSVNGVRRVALVEMTFPDPGVYLVRVSGTDEERPLYLGEASSVLDFFIAVGVAMLGGLLMLGGAAWAIIRAVHQPVAR